VLDLCAVQYHVSENDHRDAHFFSLIYPNEIILYMFWTNNCS